MKADTRHTDGRIERQLDRSVKIPLKRFAYGWRSLRQTGRDRQTYIQILIFSLVAVGTEGIEAHCIFGTLYERRSPPLSFYCLILPWFETSTHLLLS